MTKATLLKGNSTPETIRVNHNATSTTRTIGIYGEVSSVKGSPFCMVPLPNP